MQEVNYLSELARFVVFCTMAMAGLGKAVTFSDVKQNLVESFNVPSRLSTLSAALLIGVELVLALVVVFKTPFTAWGMIVSALVFLLFSLLIASLLLKDNIVRCNCFGNTEQRISGLDLVRNGLLLLACYYYLVQPASESELSLVESILLLGTAYILVQIIIHLTDIKTLVLHPFIKE